MKDVMGLSSLFSSLFFFSKSNKIRPIEDLPNTQELSACQLEELEQTSPEETPNSNHQTPNDDGEHRWLVKFNASNWKYSEDWTQFKNNKLFGEKTLIDGGSSDYPQFLLHRNVLDCENLEGKYGKLPLVEPPFFEQVVAKLHPARGCCSKQWFVRFFLNLFPVFVWLPKYNVKEYLASDVIAGFTISILHIPQGMAYGLLASAGAINGLYVSFFPILIYFLMGTSRHISIGTFAVISMMVSSATDKMPLKFETASFLNATLERASGIHAPLDDTPTRLEALITMSLCVGAIQVLMGMLRLGALTVIFSDQLVSGFSTGAAVHVATSQLKDLFGIHLTRHKGIFKIVNTYVDLFGVLKGTNLATLLISVVSILILLFFKEFINERLQNKIKMPIPIDLFIVISATFISYLSGFKQHYQVEVMGYIPTGLPTPAPPRLDLIPTVAKDSFVVALVAYAIALSMAKIFARKHKYSIRPNQELIALGGANIFSSFFSCYPCAASLSRSLVQEKTGGKTQVASLVACLFMLIVLLVLSPFFYTLPKCILSSIILVALKGMFKQISDFFDAWKISKLDALIWLITFLSVVLMDVDLGLLTGVGFSIVTVAFRTLMPSISMLGQLPESEIYLDLKRFNKAKEIPAIKIFRFGSGLYFANKDLFKKSIHQCITPPENNVKDSRVKDSFKVDMEPPSCLYLILDCSAICFLDIGGVEALDEVIKEQRDNGVKVIFASCSVSMTDTLEKSGFFDKVPNTCLFPTIHDAVIFCEYELCSVIASSST